MSFSEKITLLQNMTTMALKMKMKIQQDQQGLSPLRLTVRGSQLHLTPLLQLTMDHRLSRSMRHFTLPVRLCLPLKKYYPVSPIKQMIQTLVHRRLLPRCIVQQDLMVVADKDFVQVKQKELGRYHRMDVDHQL